MSKSMYSVVIDDILELKKQGLSNRDIAEEIFGSRSKESNVRLFLKHYRDEQRAKEIFSDEPPPPVDTKNPAKTRTVVEGDMLSYIESLEKKVQRLQDTNTYIRRCKREADRMQNAVYSLFDGLKETLSDHALPEDYFSGFDSDYMDTDKVGVIQLSDLHFGETVSYEGETFFDMDICIRRLHHFIEKCLTRFAQEEVSRVVIALTGDMLNSDRRLDELTANSNSRAKTLVQAVNILKMIICRIREEFSNITVASVVGNESRIGKDMGWGEWHGSDNFDYIIHSMLSVIFEDTDVKFVEMLDVHECLLNIDGFNLLLTHGNNKLASTNPEPEVQKLKGRWADYGTTVDYVIFGHIHSTMITNSFARSASVVGGNGYSNKALNLSSTAAQNYYIIDTTLGKIEGTSVDLSFVEDGITYPFNTTIDGINLNRNYNGRDKKPHFYKI